MLHPDTKERSATATRVIKFIVLVIVSTVFMAISGAVYGSIEGNVLSEMSNWATHGLIGGTVIGAINQKIIAGWIRGAIFGAIVGVSVGIISFPLEWIVTSLDKRTFVLEFAPLLWRIIRLAAWAIPGGVWGGMDQWLEKHL